MMLEHQSDEKVTTRIFGKILTFLIREKSVQSGTKKSFDVAVFFAWR